MKLKRKILVFSALLFGACATGAAIPSEGATLTFGTARGAPGDRVRLPVYCSGGIQLTGFSFQFDFDPDLLTFEDVAVTGVAESNGIDDIEEDVRYEGRIEIDAKADDPDYPLDDANGIIALLHFRIPAHLPYGTSATITFSGDASVRVGLSPVEALTSGNGVITVAPPVTPLPTGTPPALSLEMESAPAIGPGDEPVVEYRLLANDWKDFPVDAYFGVLVPDGTFLYLNRKGWFVRKRSALVRGLQLGRMRGFIGFGPLSPGAPPGRYTFYAVLACEEGNPLREDERITDLATASFDLR